MYVVAVSGGFLFACIRTADCSTDALSGQLDYTTTIAIDNTNTPAGVELCNTVHKAFGRMRLDAMDDVRLRGWDTNIMVYGTMLFEDCEKRMRNNKTLAAMHALPSNHFALIRFNQEYNPGECSVEFFPLNTEYVTAITSILFMSTANVTNSRPKTVGIINGYHIYTFGSTSYIHLFLFSFHDWHTVSTILIKNFDDVLWEVNTNKYAYKGLFADEARFEGSCRIGLCFSNMVEYYPHLHYVLYRLLTDAGVYKRPVMMPVHYCTNDVRYEWITSDEAFGTSDILRVNK